jgi:CBS domain-containing protein
MPWNYGKMREIQVKIEEIRAMSSLQDGGFLNYSVKELMIPSERVAHVQIGNSLEHALLVLTKSGYTAIPVVDSTYKLHGLLSTPLIMEAILGMERIEFELLQEKRVQEVMIKNIPRLTIDSTISSSLPLLVDHPFLCIEDNNRVFEGILTRRSVLSQLNLFVQSFNHQ